MADDAPPPDGISSLAAVLAQIRELLGLTDAPGLAGLSLEMLQRRTRRQLLGWARTLGITGIHRLTKEALASRLRDALARVGMAPGAPAQEPSRPPRPPKFDLGQPREPALPEHIPWGYGHDRATAMIIDSDRLYVYWEVTDEAIGRARTGLGPDGAGAWLSLRIYDVTGRIFDGTNAHSYFDHTIARDDRQWFFTIGKPTSTAVVEVGMKSAEGYFVRIARSGRAEFPRREPVGPGPVDWLTVRTATGPVEPPLSGTPPPGGVAAGEGTPAPPAAAPSPAAGGVHLVPEERLIPGEALENQWEWEQWFRSEWTEGGRHFEWRSPVLHTSWEAGPFVVPVGSPAYVEERHQGTVTVVTRNGRTHIVYGPWQIVIRGLGARAERRVLATWEMVCAWTTADTGVPGVPAGNAARAGASDRHRGAGSALRLAGASEVFLIGASELRLFGASEVFYAGASEWRLRGASEQRLGGASEWHARGASERRLGGASERQTGR